MKKTVTIKRLLVLTLILALLLPLTVYTVSGAPQQKNGYTEAANTYGAVAQAKVTKLSGNQNGLTITVSVNGVVAAEKYQLINNNSSGEFTVGDYKVYVSTSGNDKIDACFITYAPPPASQEKPGLLKVVNPRPSRAPIDAVGLSVRLDTLEGKTIAVIANYDSTMPAIARYMVANIPNIKIIYISDMEVAAGQSPRPIELEPPIQNMSLRNFEADPTIADGIVFGNGF